MIEMAFKDALYFLVLAVGVAGSHFTLRARVMVQEERLRNLDSSFGKIERSLQRIEQKLDQKVDR